MKVRQYIGETHGALPAIPSTRAYEGALEKAAAGMNEITKGLQMIGKIGEDLYKKHQERKRENDLQTKQLEAERDYLTFKTGYDRSNPDPINYAKGLERGWDEIIKKQSSTIKDGVTLNAFKNRMNQRKLSEMPRAYTEQEQRFQNQYFADSMRNVDECKNMAIETDDPERAEMFKQMMIEELEKGYPFTAEQARLEAERGLAEIKIGRAKNTKGRVYQDILSDPGGTLQKLMLPPEAGQYPDITEPSERETLRVHAQNVFKVKQTEVEQAAAKVKAEKHDAEELDIGSFYATGRLSINQIQGAQFLSGDERYAWTERIRTRQEAGVVIKTNFGTYAKIQDAIYSGQPKSEVVKRIAVASEKDLSEQDAENLLNKATAYEGSFNDQYTHRSYGYIRDRYMKPDLTNPGAFIEKFTGGNEKYYRNLNALDLEIQKAKQTGKPLRGQEIFDKAKEIVGEPKVQDYMENKKYEINKVYTDSRGQRAKYLGKDKEGRDQWQPMK